jgi:GNAT superfamily N-acetyltransferase
LAGAPIFLAKPEETKSYCRRVYRNWLSDTLKALWIAFKDGRAVSYMTVDPANPDAAFVIQDKGIASIHSAFTEEKYRGQGIGKALLNKSIEWASSMRYKNCAVDFEPENIDGSHFWMKHFKPICYTLVRNVN